MRYASVFSGIEAASAAWEPLGWEPACFAETDPFACAVLEERFPGVPNLGDVERIDWTRWRGKVDVVVGGSPCQSFSVAGKREGLKGESRLMYEFVRCVREVRPRWLLWENVPGALSVEGGEAFRCLLRELAVGGGCGLAWRVLDAQFFGVAQRRRRLFVVGRAGNGYREACEVLFEPDCLRGDTQTSREKRQALAARAAGGAGGGGGLRVAGSVGYEDGVHPTLKAGANLASTGAICMTTANTKANGSNVSEDGVAYTLDRANSNAVCVQKIAGTLTARHDSSPCIDRGSNVVCMADNNAAVDEDMRGSIKVGGSEPLCAMRGEPPRRYVVRRLTPTECERLQGFPDGWTAVPYRGRPAEECPDGPRYRALGNSMAVPVMRWIGRRIETADATPAGKGEL